MAAAAFFRGADVFETARTTRASLRRRSIATSGSNSKSDDFGFAFTISAYHAGAFPSAAYAGKGSAVDSVLPVSSEYKSRRPSTELATPMNRSLSYWLSLIESVRLLI